MNSVVCFANRPLGARIVTDLAERNDVNLVAIVTNDHPYIDLSLDASMVSVPVLPWSEYVTIAGTSLKVDRGLSVLFRHRVPDQIIDTFVAGVVNLHPSLLPFGRGSHPATLAIWEGTPYGASAHFMTATIDSGPLLAQEEIAVKPIDTSYELCAKGLDALWRIYKTDVMTWLLGAPVERSPQVGGGSHHMAVDLRQLESMDPGSLPIPLRNRLTRALALQAQASLMPGMNSRGKASSK